MPKTKKIPMRTCIACREMKPKQEMTRVVKSDDGESTRARSVYLQR